MRVTFIVFLIICTSFNSNAQTSLENNFSNLNGWTGGNGYVLTNPMNMEMLVDATNVGTSFQTFRYNFNTLDLTNAPFVQIMVESSKAFRLRIDLADADGRVTNATATTVSVAEGGGYKKYTFDFTGKFDQSWPSNATVDPSRINSILVYFNPGGPNFTGKVFMDDLIIGDKVELPPVPKDIRLNQVGYYPGEKKIAIAVAAEQDSFYVCLLHAGDTIYRGKLGPETLWNYSGEKVRIADFTEFNRTGRFIIRIGNTHSHWFHINQQVHNKLAKGLLKSYYYNRASCAITQPWADKWPRPFAHPDNNVTIHSSAATSSRPAGSVFASPRGWYDAGDYNKYMVNSGISTYTILAIYEHFPSYCDTLDLFIPESSNNIPDVLDEALWNVRWMLTCQDPGDGSVYHKVTDDKFNAVQMPHQYNWKRWAVQRGTAATLDFAAVMAQGARIFSKFPTQLPGLADSCLTAAVKAYDWAVANPNVTVTTNVTGFETGVYGNGQLSDEFDWARMELYITTGNSQYYDRSAVLNNNADVPGWPNVRTLGYISLAHHRKGLTDAAFADTTAIKNKLINLANGLRNYSQTSAYRVVMGQSSWNFTWGSNAVAGNQAMILLQAFKMTNDSSYLKAAISNLDYILGRNGTGYSYVTGFGKKYPMEPHHRISSADGVAEPVPGMVVGGPNPNQSDNCPGYPSSMPARSYVDTWCSFASNEPAINYTAPVAYTACAIEAIQANSIYVYEPAGLIAIRNRPAFNFRLYPNPAVTTTTIEIENNANKGQVEICNLSGKVLLTESLQQDGLTKINIEALEKGMYVVNVKTEKGNATQKLVVQK
ncbi:MAG: glycoside hydrolase family 9 protein [Cytophagaceae bacterium]